MILYSEGATKAQEDEAYMILGALDAAYPNHPWAVRVYDGGFFIRHLQFPTNWGMNCKYREVAHDAAVMKRKIIRMAGEWLERASIKRGFYDPDTPDYRAEGVPERFQPADLRRPDPKVKEPEMKVVIAPSNAPERTEARPQAIKEIHA